MPRTNPLSWADLQRPKTRSKTLDNMSGESHPKKRLASLNWFESKTF